MPRPVLMVLPRVGFMYQYYPLQTERYILDAATILAQVLSPTLCTLSLRRADSRGLKWSVFHLSRGALVHSDP